VKENNELQQNVDSQEEQEIPFDMSASAANILKKYVHSEKLRQDEKHLDAKVPYNNTRRKKEIVRGNFSSKKAVEESTTNYSAIQRELSYERDDGVSSEIISSPEIIYDYWQLFGYLHEDIAISHDIVSRYDEMSNTKERMDFLYNAKLADKIAILNESKNLDFANIDNFKKALQRQQEAIWEHDDRYPEDMKLGLLRDSLYASMVGSPELAAVKIATARINAVADPRYSKLREVVFLHGYDSGVFKDTTTGYGAHTKGIGNWGPLIDNYDKIVEKIYRHTPKVSAEEAEYKAVRQMATILERAYEYNGELGSNRYWHNADFNEACAAAQLGDNVMRMFRGMRNKIRGTNLSNIERFIGKSGTSEKLKSYRREAHFIEKNLEIAKNGGSEAAALLETENAFDLSKQERWKERELARLGHKWDKKIAKTRSEERIAGYEQEKEADIQKILASYNEGIAHYQNRDLETFIRDMVVRGGVIETRIEKRKSIAEKAIDLHFAMRGEGVYVTNDDYHGHWEFPNAIQENLIDWINDAPFSVIKRAHKKLRSGADLRDVCDVALLEIFSKDVSLDAEPSRESVLQLSRYFQENGVSDPHERVVLAKQIAGINNLDVFVGFDIYKTVVNSVGFENARKLLEKGINFESFIEANKSGMTAEVAYNYPWLMAQYESDNQKLIDGASDFPLDKNESARYRWCSDNSFVHLDGDWGRQTLGKIIYTRLQAGVDDSLHDATQWMETFQIPEKSYDIRRIKKDIADSGALGEYAEYEMRLINKEDEAMVLTRIIEAPQELRDRLLLSRKEQNINKLFSSPEHMLIYEQLVGVYRKRWLSKEVLDEKVKKAENAFYEEHLANIRGKDSAWRISPESFHESVVKAMEQVFQFTITENQREERIGDIMQRLNQYGENRKKYIDDATAWLTKHTTSPRQTLTSVWGNRALALREGIDDTASAIKNWQTLNAFDAFVRENPGTIFEFGLTEDELATTYLPFVNELTRCYDAESSVRAIGQFKQIANPNKIMPPIALPLKAGDSEYVGSVLAYDDPRGATIGYDTGCCMTIGGASSSCIESGYRDSGAGFFALHNKNGSIVAQSYFYINPTHPDTVVMDNIEANAGRDSNRIVELYRDYFTEYLKDRFASDPNWQVRQVNVGTGYGDVAKPLVKRLNGTAIINNDSEIYTDASNDQRLLVRLTDEQIVEARDRMPVSHTQEPIVTKHVETALTSPLGVDQLPILRDLESRLYPENMRQYGDEDFAYSELTMPAVTRYSFLIKSEKNAERAQLDIVLHMRRNQNQIRVTMAKLFMLLISVSFRVLVAPWQR
jgi:hypothetical protein